MTRKVRNIVLALIVIILLLIISMVTIFIIFISPSPDTPISTSSQVRQIVIHGIPSEYHVDSIQSVQRMSEFEDEHRLMKWLVLTLKDKTITDEKEMYEIAEPICKELLKNNTGYEGMDINPHAILRGGVNCAAWGP